MECAYFAAFTSATYVTNKIVTDKIASLFRQSDGL